MGTRGLTRTRVALATAAVLAGGGVLAAALGTAPAVAGAAGKALRRSESQDVRPRADRHGARPATTASAAVDAAGTGLVARSVLVDGVRRTFWWQRPAGAHDAPLVVALHGLHGTARGFAGATGLPVAAAAAGVVLVVPDSAGPAWNDGRLGATGPDDEAFVLHIVRRLVAEGVVDPDRVVVTGFSNGAEMTLVLAARHPEVFAGAVAVSGELLTGPGAVRPTGGVPVWFTHGDADPVQPWAGRPALSPLLPGLLSQDATVEAFRVANRAAAEPIRRTLVAGPALSGPVEETTWPAGGRDGAPVMLYRLPGAGHVWPVEGTADAAYGFSATRLVLRVAATAGR